MRQHALKTILGRGGRAGLALFLTLSLALWPRTDAWAQPAAKPATKAAPQPAPQASQNKAPPSTAPVTSTASARQALPQAVRAALERAGIPGDAVSILVLDARAQATAHAPRLAWRAQEPMNPASVMKLVTTYAALDMLGSTYVWHTPVFFGAPPQGGVLPGSLYIQGRGDPKLVMERLWMMLRRVRGMGVQRIAGDIVLDHSRFQVPAHDAARFDNNPLRPYNAAPDALLVNFKAVALRFDPVPADGVAHVQYDPPLLGMELPASVPLAPAGSKCGDWHQALKLDVRAQRIGFGGVFPAACGTQSWSVALHPPEAFASRAIAGMWQELGGALDGHVRQGEVPEGLRPIWYMASPPLVEVVRDINKFSNNVMAQQVFLTLGLGKDSAASFATARDALARWWHENWPDAPGPLVDNGSGLSRSGRITAHSLGLMLQHAWASPLMPEFVASLPLAGVDGTLRRRFRKNPMQAHLKSGTLANVSALAGYVHAESGKRYVLVAMANHGKAGAARQAWEVLVDWVARDGGGGSGAGGGVD